MIRCIHIFTSLAAALLFAPRIQAQVLPETSTTTLADLAPSRERTFVHTDRSTYLTGETIWFSVYATDARDNRPSPFSKLAYVELIAAGQTAPLHVKVLMDNGNGQGYLNLPSYLPSGNYSLRAWTNWMRNFPAEGCYQGRLTIINPGKKPEPPKGSATPEVLVGFYPEGGHLVAGSESRVAFHVTDASGKGLMAKGVVIMNGRDTVARFTTQGFGMGSFQLIPQASASYSAMLTTMDGRSTTVNLPGVEASGYLLSLQRPSSNKVLMKAEASAGMATEFLTLTLLQDHRVIKAWTGKTVGKSLTWEINSDSLPPGISHFILFNQVGNPVCERALFRKPARLLLQVGLHPDAASYGNRKKVGLSLETSDAAHLATPASLSVSVFKLDSLQGGDPDRIEQWLWLGAGLRGKVESPGQYFSDSADDGTADLLMLTQGWSRFNWDSLKASPKSVLRYAPEYAGHLITGTVTRRSDGKPMAGIPAYISVPGKRFHFSTSVSDSNGHIAFDLKKIYGSGNVVLQTGIDSTAHIEVANPWENGFPAEAMPQLRLSADLEPILRKAVLYNRIAQKPQSTPRFYFPDTADSSAFFGIPEKTYLLDDYTRFGSMDEIFREFIPEVQVRKNRNDYKLRVDHAPLGEFFTDDPLMLLDGVPYFNTNQVMAFDPLKIRKIDVVNRHFYQGSLDYPGIISMSTYAGDGAGIPLNPNALLLEYDGLQLRREFPATEYASPEQLASRQPDFRRLLHWTPSLWTGNQGLVKLAFYTGDDKGKYLVLAQGLSDNGLVGSSTMTFEVK
jgi:hypothetical protein